MNTHLAIFCLVIVRATTAIATAGSDPVLLKVQPPVQLVAVPIVYFVLSVIFFAILLIPSLARWYAMTRRRTSYLGMQATKDIQHAYDKEMTLE